MKLNILILYAVFCAVINDDYLLPLAEAQIGNSLVEQILQLDTIIISDTLRNIENNNVQVLSIFDKIINNLKSDLPTSITTIVLSLNNYVYFEKDDNVRSTLESILTLISQKFDTITISIDKLIKNEIELKNDINLVDKNLHKSAHIIESHTGACVRVKLPIFVMQTVKMSSTKLLNCGKKTIDVANSELTIIQKIISDAQKQFDNIMQNINECVASNERKQCLDELNEDQLPAALDDIEELLLYDNNNLELLDDINTCIANVSNEVNENMQCDEKFN